MLKLSSVVNGGGASVSLSADLSVCLPPPLPFADIATTKSPDLQTIPYESLYPTLPPLSCLFQCWFQTDNSPIFSLFHFTVCFPLFILSPLFSIDRLRSQVCQKGEVLHKAWTKGGRNRAKTGRLMSSWTLFSLVPACLRTLCCLHYIDEELFALYTLFLFFF